ncbi:WD40-repeat-containing domain protein [Boletus edulis BED1]|uniref:WD40-repeat-containing domain protein n=1 Tax=Boletus edulis BED1 TaxID=1328754 RepID=A0AAD4BKX2_BOLED|nr:WD40-repeat-containing domain protein [Boletus edulis BED1]
MLDKQLRDFENASRELGSSVGIVWSAFRLQERLAKILFLFRENAAYLYPRKIMHRSQEVLVNPNIMERRQDWRNRSTIAFSQDSLELDMLPDQLKSLAGDVGAFIGCLNEFDEFNDEAISQSMRSFEDDLRYFSTCLCQYKNQFRSSAVQRYVHDLTLEIGGHLDEITAALTIFIEIGIPTIWFHQQHATKNLMNVSTLSIVFGVVDASLLALSSHMTATIPAKLVNMFWMSSLLFSIAGGVNGLVGLTWKQSTYRSPIHRVPWWLLVWMKGSPLVFLVIAIACFSAGVVLFTYSSKQNPITSAIIVVMTLVASSGLISISGWFVLERWTFLRQKDQKWLGVVISETLDQLAELGIVRAHRSVMQWCSQRLAPIRTYLARFLDWLTTSRTSKTKPKNDAMTAATQVGMARHSRMPSTSSEGPGSSDSHKKRHDILDARNPRVRFQNAVRAVIELQRTTGKRAKPIRPGLPRRDSWWQTSMSSGPETSAGPVPDPGLSALRGARVAKVIEELKALELAQELFPHAALVRHIQFSPNGRYLATSSWDRKAMIFRIGETLMHHCTLLHVRGFVSQVAWSPNGRLLLTRFTRGHKLWSEDGVCKQTIDRSKTVSSVVWLPHGQAILSIEGSEVVKLDLHGKVLDVYHFGHVRLINVAVTSDCSRLIAIGPSVTPPNGPQPTRQTKVEKRIIVFNMLTRQKESQTPLFDDVRDISISKRMPFVLVSFEQAPPQLWKLEIVRDRARTNGESPLTARLNLKHSFALNVPTSIAGSCYFGGNDEQFVFCVGKAGDVHIWDRETAALLRYIRPMNMSETRDMTCIGWNDGTDESMMFATGSHDGTVRVWSTAMVNRVDEEESSTEVDSDEYRGMVCQGTVLRHSGMCGRKQ